jgi:hypothetical protein
MDWLNDIKDWPLSAEQVRLGEGYTLRTVQLWAAKNGVRTIGRGPQAPYVFFKADVLRFRERRRPGPRPEKEGKG